MNPVKCIGFVLLLCFSIAGGLKAQAAPPAGLDSLRARADSLSRLADSLRATLDSLSKTAAVAVKPAPKPAAQPERKPWTLGYGLGYTLNRGNSRQTTLVSNLELAFKGQRTQFRNEASVSNSTVQDGPGTNKASFSSKFELDQSERFFYFTSLDLDHNRQAGLNLRIAPGLGAGYIVVNEKDLKLKLNLGANPITEYFLGLPRNTRGYYLAIQELALRINSRARLQQSLAYKPRFDAVQAYFMNLNIAFTNQITSSLSLKVNLEGKYNSRPPAHTPPYQRQDWMFYTAVSYSIW